MVDCMHIEYVAGEYYKDGTVEMVPLRCAHCEAFNWDYQLVCSVCPYHRDRSKCVDEVPF